jgi:lipid-A-disaccharide synthase-like uncharacterized protein
MHRGFGLLAAGLMAFSQTGPINAWAMVGYLGQGLFFSRFVVQWIATERRRQVTIPTSFWWLSLGGATLLLAYAIHKVDGVFITGQAISWIPYVRNLRIHYREKARNVICSACSAATVKSARYCHACGQAVPVGNDSAK